VVARVVEIFGIGQVVGTAWSNKRYLNVELRRNGR
jgi:hypothetical protein